MATTSEELLPQFSKDWLRLVSGAALVSDDGTKSLGSDLYIRASNYSNLPHGELQALLNDLLETPLPEHEIDSLPADFKSLLCFHAFCRIALFQFQQPWYTPDPSFYAKELSHMSIWHQIRAMWFSSIIFLRHWMMRDDVRLPIKLLLLPLMSLLVFTLLAQAYTIMQSVLVLAYVGEAVLSTMAWVITCGRFQFSPLRNAINQQWFLTNNPENNGGNHSQRRWMMVAFLFGGLVSVLVPSLSTLSTIAMLMHTSLEQCAAAVSADRSRTLKADAAIQRLPRPRDTAPGRYPASCFSTLFYRQKGTTAAESRVVTAATVAVPTRIKA